MMKTKNPVRVQAGIRAATTRKWKKASRKARGVGIRAEGIAKEWLEAKRFNITDSHTQHPSNRYYDLKGDKKGKTWILEVKSGRKPQIKLNNFEKVLHEKNVDMFGLILVIDGRPHLLSYNLHKYRGELAWERKIEKSRYWDKNRKIRSKAIGHLRGT